MIWIVAAIGVLLFFVAWMIDHYLVAISNQIGQLHDLLRGVEGQLDEANGHLGRIVDYTGRLPKPPERRLPEYPGDPLGKWPTD